MTPFAEWFPLALVGGTFTIFGSLKLWGLWRGVVGGKGKSVAERACGT